jgi:coatomer protein complex subunit alpha (xenin)
LAVAKSTLSDLDGASSGVAGVDEGSDDEGQAGGDWGGDDDDLFDSDDEGPAEKVIKKKAPAEEGAWDEDDDLDISDDEEDAAPTVSAGRATKASSGSMYTAGISPQVAWCAESSLSADHLAAGSVDTALQLLNRQIAAVNVSVIRQNAVATYLSATAYLPGLPLTPPSKTFLMRESLKDQSKPMPAVCMKIAPLLDSLKQAYRSFTSGQFVECKGSLDFIFHSIPLVVTSSRTASNDIKELLEVCREYITAIRVKSKIGETEDTVKSLELAAYFTHCNLQPSHLMLALKSAMASAFRAKNYVNAASFARRLLELPETNSERHADVRTKAQKVLSKSEQQGRNEHQIDYDEMNPFTLDCAELKPIYKGSPSIKCPFCFSTYSPDFKGKLCVTCNLSTVGVETIGLVSSAVATRK